MKLKGRMANAITIIFERVLVDVYSRVLVCLEIREEEKIYSNAGHEGDHYHGGP